MSVSLHNMIPNPVYKHQDDTDQYHIQGVMFTVQHKLFNADFLVNPLYVKRELTYKLAEELLKKDMIEFTSQEDMYDGSRTIRARIFVTPKDYVQILRTKFGDRINNA